MSDHACACGGNCSCNSESQVTRVYLTRDEYVARLEQYLVDLKAEIQAVEAELLELRQEAAQGNPAEIVAETAG